MGEKNELDYIGNGRYKISMEVTKEELFDVDHYGSRTVNDLRRSFFEDVVNKLAKAYFEEHYNELVQKLNMNAIASATTIRICRQLSQSTHG